MEYSKNNTKRKNTAINAYSNKRRKISNNPALQFKELEKEEETMAKVRLD